MPNMFQSWKQLENCKPLSVSTTSLQSLIESFGDEIFINLNSFADREIQASGFEGPIPSSLALLHNLMEL